MADKQRERYDPFLIGSGIAGHVGSTVAAFFIWGFWEAVLVLSIFSAIRWFVSYAGDVSFTR